MVPVWITAAARVRAQLKTREAPLLALGAAFCFTIMMFNIPALGGTTAHPVAGTLLAILLGPAAAIIGVTVALAIQALFFGDGGIFAFGANCLTMAFILPMVGYWIYAFTARKLPVGSRFRPLCAAIGSYAGINAAAAVVALLLGLQPLFFAEANGHALYFPFGLSITLPAMLGTHLIVAGPAEAFVTMFAVAYLQSAGYALYGTRREPNTYTTAGILVPKPAFFRRKSTIWLLFVAMIVLTPLGLLAKGEAWGEWDSQHVSDEIKRLTHQDYVPKGMTEAEKHVYKGAHGLEDYGSVRGPKGYLFSAGLGVLTIFGCLLVVGNVLGRRDSLTTARETFGTVQPTPKLPIGADGPLPNWLKSTAGPAVEIVNVPVEKRSNQYIARSVADLARRCSTALGAELWPSKAGYLQGIDARAKLAAVLCLIAAVSTSHALIPLLSIYFLTLVAAHSSAVPLVPYCKRIWLAVPLFAGGIVVPLVFDRVTPGPDVWIVSNHPHIGISAAGLKLATVIVVRIGTAVSLAALLALTTHWADLLAALRYFFVPRLFIDILAMTYRYAILLMNSASEMFLARSSRSVGSATNSQDEGVPQERSVADRRRPQLPGGQGLAKIFDGAINEQCFFEFSECDRMIPFRDLQKPVFVIQYNTDPPSRPRRTWPPRRRCT